jgi:hypothetical protein
VENVLAYSVNPTYYFCKLGVKHLLLFVKCNSSQTAHAILGVYSICFIYIFFAYTVEVRFEHLTVDAECYVGSRGLPTLWNTAKNLVDYLFGMVGLSLTKKINLTILKDSSGILKPSR